MEDLFEPKLKFFLASHTSQYLQFLAFRDIASEFWILVLLSADDPIFELSASREKAYKQIEAAIAKYREIKENINEGLKFYVTLQVRKSFHHDITIITHIFTRM